MSSQEEAFMEALDNLIQAVNMMKDYIIASPKTAIHHPSRVYVQKAMVLEFLESAFSFYRPMMYYLTLLRRLHKRALRDIIYTDLLVLRARLNELLLAMMWDPERRDGNNIYFLYTPEVYDTFSETYVSYQGSAVDLFLDAINGILINAQSAKYIPKLVSGRKPDPEVIYVIYRKAMEVNDLVTGRGGLGMMGMYKMSMSMSQKGASSQKQKLGLFMDEDINIKVVHADTPEAQWLMDFFSISVLPAIVYPKSGVSLQGVDSPLSTHIAVILKQQKMDFVIEDIVQPAREFEEKLRNLTEEYVDALDENRLELSFYDTLKDFRFLVNQFKKVLEVEWPNFIRVNTDIFSLFGIFEYYVTEFLKAHLMQGGKVYMNPFLIMRMNAMIAAGWGILGILDVLIQEKPADIPFQGRLVTIVGRKFCKACQKLKTVLHGFRGIPGSLTIDYVDATADRIRGLWYFQRPFIAENRYDLIDMIGLKGPPELGTLKSPVAFYKLDMISVGGVDSVMDFLRTVLYDEYQKILEDLQKLEKAARQSLIAPTPSPPPEEFEEGEESVDVGLKPLKQVLLKLKEKAKKKKQKKTTVEKPKPKPPEKDEIEEKLKILSKMGLLPDNTVDIVLNTLPSIKASNVEEQMAKLAYQLRVRTGMSWRDIATTVSTVYGYKVGEKKIRSLIQKYIPPELTPPDFWSKGRGRRPADVGKKEG